MVQQEPEGEFMQRAIGLCILVALVSAAFAESPASSESKDLFDGKTLDGWDGDSSYWSVEDGAITGRTTPERKLKHNTFLIWKGGKVKDFELRLKYKLASGNSGVQYRSRDDGDHRVSGYQADIVGGANDKYSGILYDENGRGILAQRGQKVVIDEAGKKNVVGSVGESDAIFKAIKQDDWNEYTITAKGNHLVQKINGVTTVDVTDEQSAKAVREGILALQIHVGDPMVVQFKELRLTELNQ
jgi:hypothetical protein